MPQSAYDYLGEHTLLTLATASSDGRPHAAPIFYVTDGKAIYFSVASGSESARNLAQNPQASISIADVPSDWSKARGLQMNGSVAEAGEDAGKAAELFGQRFPSVGDASSYSYLRFDATEIHYVHNDEDGDEDIEALGIHWLRETVQP